MEHKCTLKVKVEDEDVYVDGMCIGQVHRHEEHGSYDKLMFTVTTADDNYTHPEVFDDFRAAVYHLLCDLEFIDMEIE